MCLVDVAVGEDDVVYTLVHALLRLLAEVVDGHLQAALPLRDVEEHRELDGLETLVAYVAEDVELGVGQHRLRQADHLAVALVRSEDVGSHASDVLLERHNQILADRVDGWVGHLGELLAEIVVEYLRAVGQDGQRGVVAHRGHRLLAGRTHRDDGLVDVFLAETEVDELALVVLDLVLDVAATLDLLELDAVG